MSVITSASNPQVKAARRLHRRAERARTAAFLVEGPQAVSAAVGHLQRLFVTPEAAARAGALIAAAETAGAQVLQVAPAVLDALADTVTPQGVVGVAVVAPRTLDDALDAAGLVLVLCEARDPGNVGTIIRTADAAGADAVILTSGSVDPRNPKAVRASAGSVFHLPVVSEASWDAVVAGCRQRGIKLLAAAPRGGVDASRADLSPPAALVFGGEAAGLDPSALALCDQIVQVPVYGRAESLNLAAAAAVLSYEAAWQRRAQDLDPMAVAR